MMKRKTELFIYQTVLGTKSYISRQLKKMPPKEKKTTQQSKASEADNV